MINSTELEIIKNFKRLEYKIFKKSYPELYQKIINKWFFSEKPNAIFSEKVYHYVYDKPPFCGGNNLLKYDSFNGGYKSTYCKEKNCEYCHERKLIKNKLNYEASKLGVLKKHGTDNVFKLQKFQDKAKCTIKDKYGVDNVFKLQEFQDLAKEIIKEKYGTDNVFKLQEFQDMAREIIKEKYGVDNVFKLQEFQDLAKEIIKEKYGVNHPMYIDHVIELFKDNTFGQKHLLHPDIINDEKLFIEFSKDKNIYEIAEYVGCSDITIRNRFNKWDIEYEGQTYYAEKNISEFLQENNINFICNNRTLIKPLEIDFYLTEYNIGIEHNGNYWHSNKFKPNDYHNKKYLLAENNSVILLQFFEDEWLYKKDIIKNIILNKINKFRYDSHEVKIITNKEANNIHLKENKSDINYGLFIDDNLIDCLSFNIIDDVYHITKFPLYFYKELFNHINYKNIIGEADLRFFEHKSYEELGFSFIKDIDPKFKYSYQDLRLDENLNNKCYKIYDAGYKLFKL